MVCAPPLPLLLPPRLVVALPRSALVLVCGHPVWPDAAAVQMVNHARAAMQTSLEHMQCEEQQQWECRR